MNTGVNLTTTDPDALRARTRGRLSAHLLVTVLAGLAVAAPTFARTTNTTPTSTSNLAGIVKLYGCAGPQHPGQSCVGPPYRGARITVLRQQDHRRVAHVTSDRRGRFAFELNPGRYLLKVQGRTGDVAFSKSERAVRVRAGHVTHVTLYLDSGAR